MKSAKNSATIKMLALPALVRGCFEAGSAAAGCALLLATAGAAYAQQPAPAAAPASAAPADDAQLEAITVMGTYERSLVQSMDTKRNATSIVEAVSAEDIGKLPDSSIAEAISRLPGLAGQRVDGRQSSISVRGFGEDFSATTFNGREQVSISDNRSVEFDVYPSEIMSGVTVYKTPDASLLTQGIGGTIDLRSTRPLEAKKSLSVSADYEKNSLDKLSAAAKNTGGRGTVSYVDKFDDNKLGVALALSVMDSPNQEERWQTWGYATDKAGNSVLGGAKPFVRSSELKRNTFMGVVEFAPVSGLKLTGDALYIDYKDDKILKGIEIPGAYGGPYTETGVSGGFVNSGVFTGRDVQVRNDFEKQDAKLKTLGLNAKYELDKDWTLNGDLSWGQVQRDVFSLESYSGLGRPTISGSNCSPVSPGDNIGFTQTGGNQGATFTHGVNYADPNLIHLGGAQCWGNGNTVPHNAQDGFINFPHIDDTIKSLKLSAETAVSGSFINNVEIGINYTNRTKAKQDHGVFLTLPNYPGVDSVPAGFAQSPTSLGFIGMGNMLSYDSYALWQSGYYKSTSENLTVATRALNTWSVDEKVTTLFGKADIESHFYGLPLGGNFGAQVVQTNQSSDGFEATNLKSGLVTATPVSSGATYTKILPSMNLILKTASDQDARFSVARTMSRSRMDRENASFGNTYDTTKKVWGGNFSNTSLKPQLSDQLDLSYSWYYRKDAFVSAAAFYKHLTDWQVQSVTAVDLSGFPSQDGSPLPAGTTGYVSKWINSSKSGFVRGVEFQGLLPGAVFSPALDGLGLSGSATFLSSSVSVPVTTDYTKPAVEVPITVPGLSHNIYNLTAYYEKHGFGIRFSGTQRSDFLGEEPGTSFIPVYVTVAPQRVIDAQVSYNFEETGINNLKGLTVTFQVQNLTNEPFITYFNKDDPRTVRDHQNYGRDYLLGFRYKF